MESVKGIKVKTSTTTPTLPTILRKIFEGGKGFTPLVVGEDEHWLFLPRDLGRMVQLVKENHSCEVRFSPCLYYRKTRESPILWTRSVHVDLADSSLDQLKVEPTYVWKTSCGGHQGLWLLAEENGPEGDEIDPEDVSRLLQDVAVAEGLQPSGRADLILIPGCTSRGHRVRPRQIGSARPVGAFLRAYGSSIEDASVQAPEEPTQAEEAQKSRMEIHRERVRSISLSEDFYDTPELSSIRHAARSKAAHPDGVLGVLLTRVSALLHPSVAATTGMEDTLSLNFYAGVVSPPGGGKDRSMAAARALLPIPEEIDAPQMWDMGTGEGLLDAYLEERDLDEDRKEWIQVHSRVALIEPESQTLFTLMDRHGSLLPSLALKMWGGSDVGTGNSKAGGRKRSLSEGSYRYAMALGFQPEKISELLRKKGVGLPHRFVLFNSVPETRLGTGDPIEALVDRARWLTALRDTHVAFPQEIRQELDRISEEQLCSLMDPDQESIDSHLYVLLVKLTALVCLLHGRVVPTMDDFLKAKAITDSSATVREEAHSRATREADQKAQEEGRRFAVIDEIRAEAKQARDGDDRLMARAVLRIVNKVGKRGLCSVRDAKKAVDSQTMNKLRSIGEAHSTQEVLEEAVRRKAVIVEGQTVKLPRL